MTTSTSKPRAVLETPLRQGEQESIVYELSTTPWGSSPGSVVVTAYEITEGAYTDVSATVLDPGGASVVGDKISLPALSSLTAGKLYRVEVKFTCGSNTFECYVEIEAEN